MPGEEGREAAGKKLNVKCVCTGVHWSANFYVVSLFVWHFPFPGP